MALLAERFDRPQRVLLLFDPLEAMAALWGAESAGHFFARCCPMLLELGAIAYWSLSRGDVPAGPRREG